MSQLSFGITVNQKSKQEIIAACAGDHNWWLQNCAGHSLVPTDQLCAGAGSFRVDDFWFAGCVKSFIIESYRVYEAPHPWGPYHSNKILTTGPLTVHFPTFLSLPWFVASFFLPCPQTEEADGRPLPSAVSSPSLACEIQWDMFLVLQLCFCCCKVLYCSLDCKGTFIVEWCYMNELNWIE